LKTALRLTDYELDMDAKKIYTLVALAAYYNKVPKKLFRATSSVQEHLSSWKVWVVLKIVRDTPTSL